MADEEPWRKLVPKGWEVVGNATGEQSKDPIGPLVNDPIIGHFAQGVSGAVEGASGVIGLPGTVGRLMDRYIVDPVADWMGLPPRADRQKRPDLLPTGAEVEDVVRGVTGIPKMEPRGASERLARDAGQAVGGMIVPGTAVPNMVGAGTGWAAGEAARGLGLGEKAAEWARLGGNLAGAGGAAVAQATRPTASKMLARRMEHYTPADIQRATALQAEAQARGVPLMAQEALDATPAGPMAALASTVAATPQGGASMARFVTERQPMIAAATENAASAIGPRVTDGSKVARNVATAAEEVVADPKIARAALAKPYYQAAAAEPLQGRMWQGIVDKIDNAIAGPNVVPGGALERELVRLKSLAQNSSTVGHGDTVLKEFDAIAKATAFASGEPVTEAVRAILKPILTDMRAGLKGQSANYAKGLALYDDLAPETIAVKVAEGGPSARIAGAQTNPAKEGAAVEFARWAQGEQSAKRVADEIAKLQAKDPTAARDAIRLMVQKAGDDAFATMGSGGPVNVGVKTAQGIAPTPQSRANMVAAIEAATGNKTTAAGMDRLLTILERTGVTPGVGSPTATRAAALTEAGRGGAVGPTVDALNVMRGSVLPRIKDWNEQMRAGKAWADLGRILTDPDSVAKVRKLALMDPASDKARILASEILAAERGGAP